MRSVNDIDSAARKHTITIGTDSAANNIATGAARLHGILVTGDGTNAPLLKVYNALTATGTPFAQATALATGSEYYDFGENGVAYTIGLSYEWTSGQAGQTATIVWSPDT